MSDYDWQRAAIQWLEHLERSGISHLPRAHDALPASIRAWAPRPSPVQRASHDGSVSVTSRPDSQHQEALRTPLRSAENPRPEPPPVPHTPSTVAAGRTPAPAALETVSEQAGKWATPAGNDLERQFALQQLDLEVKQCRKCTDIACRRTQTVFGVGPVRPRLVMFGEAPGAEEDRKGEPFVGPAGQLLDRILVASGLSRDSVYIMNTLKCRPPGNRTPVDSEIDHCRPFFEQQLEILQPEYIVCWGAVAAKAVLKRTESIGRLRGRFHSYKQAKVLVTYHPSYLLRTPEAKRLTWEDMKFLMRDLGIPVP